MNRSKITYANAVTLFRLGLIFGFITLLFFGKNLAAVYAFAAAWILDVVDGWLARYFKQETQFGYTFDKAVDRFLMGGGVFFMLAFGLLPDYAILLLTKDIGNLPALEIHAARGERVAGLGRAGKLVTMLQGMTILWLLAGGPSPLVAVLIVAILGGVLAVRHLRQVVFLA